MEAAPFFLITIAQWRDPRVVGWESNQGPTERQAGTLTNELRLTPNWTTPHPIELRLTPNLCTVQGPTGEGSDLALLTTSGDLKDMPVTVRDGQ